VVFGLKFRRRRRAWLVLSLLIAVVSASLWPLRGGAQGGCLRLRSGEDFVTHWTDFGLGQMPSLSARRPARFPAAMQALVDERAEPLREPFRGLTTEGTIRPGLFPLQVTGVSTAPITQAAVAFAGALSAEQRQRAVLPLDSDERRKWLNAHPFVFRHGVMLEELASDTRRLGLDLLRASLSARGFAQARDIMQLNGLLAEVTGMHDDYAEWLYFLSLFGEPGPDRPWAWQIDGHHLCVNCTVIGDQMVLTPVFMGSEPCHVFSGPLAGTMVFAAEERAGLSLIRSLGGEQASRAILQPSINPGDLPADLLDPLDGRIAAGAWRDNAVVPYAGVCAANLSGHQRHRLRALVATYAGWAREGHSGVKMSEVDRHLNETYFAWMGAVSDDGPFYYRVHSPVVLIEFDHQPGVAFDNPVPSPNHIHTIVRTPNGGDYGADLLRQHHERFDHTHGTHALRAAPPGHIRTGLDAPAAPEHR
jgi:hypothetical protein